MGDDERAEHVKTVYAHFGLAIYLAQCLEHGIVNALLVLDLVPNQAKTLRSKNEWNMKVDDFFDQNFRQTLGQMITALRKVTTVPTKLETLLAEALHKRNWLAHHYFRERAEQFMSASGRDHMIAELEDVQKLFREADLQLEEISRPLMEKYGYTEAKLAAAFEELRRRTRDDL